MGASANGGLIDNGDGTFAFYLLFEDSDIVGDGFIVEGAGFSVLDDDSLGVAHAHVGGAGDVVTGTVSGARVTFLMG